jgi:hypothetical protein
MQIERGFARGVPAALPIHLMAVAHVEHAAVVGLDCRESIVPQCAPPLSSRPPLGSRMLAHAASAAVLRWRQLQGSKVMGSRSWMRLAVAIRQDQSGSSPLTLITAAAAGVVRNLTSASVGLDSLLWMPIEKVVND